MGHSEGDGSRDSRALLLVFGGAKGSWHSVKEDDKAVEAHGIFSSGAEAGSREE